MRRLAADLTKLGDVGGLLCTADAEDRRLPPIALSSEILVLGSLGRDAAWQRDIFEHGVVLGHGHVDLHVLGLLLGLLLVGCDLVLESGRVLLVHVGGVLRIRLGLFDGTLGLSVNTVSILVTLLESILDLLLDNLRNDRLHDLQQERLRNSKQQLVVRLLDLDLKVINLDINVLNHHEASAVLWLSIASLQLEAEALATQDDVHDTLVGDGGEALLLLQVVSDVTEIHLDAGCGDHEAVVALALDRLATHAPVVVAADFHGIGEEIVTLDDKVLNDDIDHGVRDLDTWDGDVASVLEDVGDDDLGQILDEMRLECRLAILILTQVGEELLGGTSEGLVLGILVELLAIELELVENAVRVISVSLAEEESAFVVDLVPLIVGLILQDVALLLETLADVLVETLEPVLEFRVLVGITVDLVKGIEEVIKTGRVGEAFDEGLEFCQRCFVIFQGTCTHPQVSFHLVQTRIVVRTLDSASTLFGEVFAVACVGLG